MEQGTSAGTPSAPTILSHEGLDRGGCDPHLDLWAKLGKAEYPSRYHPLLFHLIDAGQVASALWRRVARPWLRHHVSEALGLASAEDGGRWLAFWVAAHDVGKASPGFAERRNTSALV